MFFFSVRKKVQSVTDTDTCKPIFVDLDILRDAFLLTPCGEEFGKLVPVFWIPFAPADERFIRWRGLFEKDGIQHFFDGNMRGFHDFAPVALRMVFRAFLIQS
jgi:hypothetical protein